MVMPLMDHQAPIHLGEPRVDAPSRIGSQVQSTLEPIVAALGHFLPRALDAARRTALWEQTTKAANLTLVAEVLRRVEKREQDGRELGPDPWNGAQGVAGVQTGIELVDPTAEFPNVLVEQLELSDLLADFELQGVEIHRFPDQGEGFVGGCAQVPGEILDERSAARLVTRRMASDEPDQAPRLGRQHPARIEVLAEHGPRQSGPQIGQHGLEGRAGPADQIEQAPLAGTQTVLVALALFGETPQGMLLGAGHEDWFERGAAEVGYGPQDIGVAGVCLSIFAQVSAQRLDALPLDPDHADAGAHEPERHRKPRHPGRLQDRLHLSTVRQAGPHFVEERAQRLGREAEADGRADGLAMVEDLGDVVAADRQVDADGALEHGTSSGQADPDRAALSCVSFVADHRRHHLVTLARSAAPDRARAEPRRDDRGSLKLFRSWPKLIRGGDIAPNPGAGAGPQSHRQGGRSAP